uniref:Uncharacterized protein n=1 Tax=Romanomermis culicivorax TaxID=13658 RepID=A0A915KB19_ROMCU
MEKKLSVCTINYVYCTRTVVLYTLGTSSPQPAKIGYKYDFELRLTTNDVGTYSGMNFSANTPQEMPSPPVQNRFCRTPTMSSSGQISAASAIWYGTAFDNSDVISTKQCNESRKNR